MSNKKYTITFTPKEYEWVFTAVCYYETELEQTDYDDRKIPESHPFMRALRKVAAAQHG